MHVPHCDNCSIKLDGVEHLELYPVPANYEQGELLDAERVKDFCDRQCLKEWVENDS